MRQDREADRPLKTALDATVVIPCFNAASTLPDQLEALARQNIDSAFEVIIVDNASTDTFSDRAMEFAGRFASFRIIRATEYHSAGYARDVGGRNAHTDKLLFCDADDVADEGWVAAMSEALEQSMLVGGAREFQSLNAVWHPYLRKQSEGATDRCDLHFFGDQQFRHVGAGNLAVRRSVFLELGGFDPELKVHEDVDFCVRAQLAGYTLDLCPSALMHIRARSNLFAFFSQGRVWGYWSVALLKKHRALLGRPHIIRPIFGWGRLMMRLFMIRSREDLFMWTYRLGWRIGRLAGSIAMGFTAL